MWLYDNYDRRGGRWSAIVSVFNVFLVVLGLYLMISGVSSLAVLSHATVH